MMTPWLRRALALAIVLALGLLVPWADLRPYLVLQAAPPAFVSGQVCTNTDDNAGGSIACTMPGNTTTGNFLTCAVSWFPSGSTITSVTDGTNGQAQAVTATHASAQRTDIWYVANITGLTTPTLTATFSTSVGSFRRIACGEYNGIVTSSALGVTSSNVSGNGTSHTSNSATTTAGNELIIGAFMSENQTASWTAGTSFTVRGQTSADYKLMLEDRVQATVASVEATATLSASADATALMATFKATDTGSTPTSPPQLMMRGVGLLVVAPEGIRW